MSFFISFVRQFLKSLLLLALFGLLLQCRNFDEPTVKKSLSKPKPSGNIYFTISGSDSVYFLDADDHHFKTLPLSLHQLWDFDISLDGNWLVVAQGSQMDRYNLLKFRHDYSRTLKYLPRGRITCSKDGRVIIYETEYQATRRLAVMYIETGDNFVLKSANNGAAFSPLIAPSGQEYAWAQYDGMYYGRLNQTTPVRLINQSFEPEDFSPSGTYLTAGGKIYDVRALSQYPGKHGGRLRFIDDYFLIQQKPSDCDSLEKINISGTERTFLFHTGIPIVDFEVADGQRFVVAVSAGADAESLLFFIYDFVDLQKEFNLEFPVGRQVKLKKLIWPARPSSLTQHD